MKRPTVQAPPKNLQFKSKVKRRIIHAIWPKLVQGQVWGAREGIRQVLMNYEDGLTKGEAAYIRKREEQLATISSDLNKIYFRVKF